MTHSVARPYLVTCSSCGQPFAVDVWEIVDSEERPDLFAQIIENTLHMATCPGGHSTHVRAPQLLYRPSSDTPLLFSDSVDTDGFKRTITARPDLGERLLTADRKAESEGWNDPYHSPPPESAP